MLIKCPECELNVSDKAIICPHCGYPLDKSAMNRRVSRKHKSLPNGFGQISFIKNQNLRKPYRAMVSVGKKPNGRPICRILKPEGYFETYNEAYAALVEYNKNPYELNDDITMDELYKRWYSELEKMTDTSKSLSTIRSYKSAWDYCSMVYDIPVKSMRIRNIKQCINDGYVMDRGVKKETTPYVKNRIKALFNKLFDYAVEYELVTTNIARNFELPKEINGEYGKNHKNHIAFSDEEMTLLWEKKDTNEFIEILLVQCYTGLRPSELGLIEIQNTDINEWKIIGGMKTKAGMNRVIPIHPKIRPIVKKFYDLALNINAKYLFNCTDARSVRKYLHMNYDMYSTRFENIIIDLGMNPNHRPHDGRVQFITMAKRFDVDEYAIKRIVGHAIADITEKVYTKRSFDWLMTEISKIDM